MLKDHFLLGIVFTYIIFELVHLELRFYRTAGAPFSILIPNILLDISASSTANIAFISTFTRKLSSCLSLADRRLALSHILLPIVVLDLLLLRVDAEITLAFAHTCSN
jgi:hypothetical protein